MNRFSSWTSSLWAAVLIGFVSLLAPSNLFAQGAGATNPGCWIYIDRLTDIDRLNVRGTLSQQLNRHGYAPGLPERSRRSVPAGTRVLMWRALPPYTATAVGQPPRTHYRWGIYLIQIADQVNLSPSGELPLPVNGQWLGHFSYTESRPDGQSAEDDAVRFINTVFSNDLQRCQ